MLKKTKKFLASIQLGIMALAMTVTMTAAPQVALAANPPPAPGTTATTQTTQTSGAIVPGTDILPNVGIIDVVRNIIRFIIIVAFVIAFIMLIIGGIRWILAGGDEKAVEKARGTITAALIGLVVVLIAFALIKLVETFFGIHILTGGVTIPTVTTQ